VIALAGAVALTPAGARVGDWIGSAIDPSPSRSAAVLPAPGDLLISGPNGSWIVRHDLRATNLADAAEADWSARGNYVALSASSGLVVKDTSGAVRWTVNRPHVANIAWAPGDGYRVAYRSGWQLRVVNGDGTGDRLIDRLAAFVTPAWRPGPLGEYELAYVGPGGQVIVRDIDSPWRSASRRLLTRSRARVEALAWAGPDRLLVQRAGALLLIDAHGHVLASQPKPTRGRFTALTASPVSGTAAFVQTGGAGRASVVWSVRLRAEQAPRSPAGATNRAAVPRLLAAGAQITFAGKATIHSLAFSPDGRWLAFTWPQADQLLFQRIRGRPRLLTVGSVKHRLAHDGNPAASGVVGWAP
jgi:hypothetical protein